MCTYRSGDTANDEREQLKLEAERIADAIAKIGGSPTLIEKMQATESRIAEISQQLQLAASASSEPSVDSIRNFVTKALGSLPELLAQLDRLAPTLLKFTKTTLTVVTHTDDTGGAFFNRDLSRRRAEVVRNYLLKLGIPSERLATEGRGGDQPRDSNDSEAGQERNRRMEIYIRPSLQ